MHMVNALNHSLESQEVKPNFEGSFSFESLLGDRESSTGVMGGQLARQLLRINQWHAAKHAIGVSRLVESRYYTTISKE